MSEKIQLRNSLISDYNAQITFTDGSDPLIQQITEEFVRSNEEFTYAYDEIQYVAKGKALDQYANTINTALNVMIKNVKQLTIYINRGGNMRGGYMGQNQGGQNYGQNDPNMNQNSGYQEQQAYNEQPQEQASQGFDFFAGCSSEADLKKRYRDLMKSFHPDGEIGDEDSVKQINDAYEEAKKRFE